MTVLRCKVAVVGDPTVGKSAWLQMFFSNGTNFPRQYMMTTTADLCIKEVEAPETGNTVELYVYDIAGNDVYRRFVEPMVDGASFFVVVYDVGHRQTFESCLKWAELCRKGRKTMPGVLIANKSDLGDRVEVADAQGETFARQHNLTFFKISALRGDNISAPMQHIAQKFSAAYEERAKTLQYLK
eukprot:PhF_6_TR43619/c0_g1_i1/m.67012/K07934/IFT27, RAYL, RABL4; intraflagellar transport protein 27